MGPGGGSIHSTIASLTVQTPSPQPGARAALLLDTPVALLLDEPASHFHPVSTMQTAEHPSAFFVFPSSHFSAPSRLPLPQTAEEDDDFEEDVESDDDEDLEEEDLAEEDRMEEEDLTEEDCAEDCAEDRDEGLDEF